MNNEVIDARACAARYIRNTAPPPLPPIEDDAPVPDYCTQQIEGRPSLLDRLLVSERSIRLWDCQHDNFNRTIHVMLRGTGHPLNTSATGNGKTHIGCAVAAYFDAELFVLSPLTVNDKWCDVAARWGVRVHYVASYETLRGQAFHPLRHNFLVRTDAITGRKADGQPVGTSAFAASPAFLSLIDRRARLLLVFDEVQKIKDPRSDLARACHALVGAVPLGHESVHVLCLSRTPIDKTVFSESLLRMAGVLRGPLFEFVAAVGGGVACDTPEWHQMTLRARAIDNVATASILYLNKRRTAADYRWVAWLLFRDVFRRALVHEVPVQVLPGVHMDVANGFYTFDAATERLITAQLDAIARCLHLTATGKGEMVDLSMLAAAVPHMVELQRLKVPMFASLARAYLAAHPSAKIVLFVTYHAAMSELATSLSDLGALVLNGKCKRAARTAIIASFQDPRSSCRVLISNPIVGGVGIDLDDKIGDFPRAAFLMPDFSINNLIQAMRRLMRLDTRQNSDVPAMYVRFVYTNTIRGTYELRILQLLYEKLDVINASLAAPDATLFPTRNVRYDAEMREMGDFDLAPLIRKPVRGSP